MARPSSFLSFDSFFSQSSSATKTRPCGVYEASSCLAKTLIEGLPMSMLFLLCVVLFNGRLSSGLN
jgi:hypothetical protein